MTGKGAITRTPTNQFRLMLLIQILWLALVLGLGIWWSQLALTQAARIYTLEGVVENWQRMQRMIFWESTVFLALILGSAAALFWLYWRHIDRTRSLQAFFASMTHELRTPLTSIRLQSETIAEGIPSDSAQRRLVDRLLEDVLRLESQVERTLELARVEGGGAVFTQTVRLKPIIERLVTIWKESYGSRVRFEVNLSEDAVVEADSNGLQIIVKNLLENSMRYAGQEALEFRVVSRADGDKIALEFQDNGPGTTLKGLGSLFNKGVGSSGAGVGLYLVRTLMERMGGEARFDGQSGGFRTTLLFRKGASTA